MQPMYIQPVGSVNFTKSKADAPFKNTTQIVFSSSSATVCLYDSHKLECFRDSPNWSHQFTWIPVLHLKTLLKNITDSPEDLHNWHIVKAIFVNTSTKARQSLAVILVNVDHNLSIVCFFRSLSSTKCIISVLIHGVLTTLEWLPLIDMTCKTPESLSLASTTMDMCYEETTKGSSKISNSVLSIFDGCFALGFQQGLAGLLDMCLTYNRDDHLVDDKPEMSVAVERSQCLNCVSGRKPISQLSNDTKIEHALVYFDASVLRWNDFTYKSVSGKTLASIPSAGVYVSTLSYIPQVQGLAVGFSFGGWQLWSLSRLNMEFCLRQATPAVPVVSFNFLEPSDDPRFCCFLWVGWQSKQETESSDVFKFTGKPNPTTNFENPTVKLFQLSYKRRYELASHKHKGFNFYYQDLIGIADRLSTTLSGDKSDDSKPQYPSKLLSVQSLHAPDDFVMDSNNNNSNSGNHSVGTIRLIAFIWKFSDSIIRIGLFDLDRWYHAQMPTYIRSDNTFIAIFDASIPSQKVQLLYAYLIESSLMSFWSRIVQRESCLVKCCEAYPPLLFDSSSKSSKDPDRIMIPMVNNNNNSGSSKRPRPIPEVLLRPSSLSFHSLILWINDTIGNNILNFSIGNHHSLQHYDCLYNISRINFASRQEECLLQLSKYEKKFSTIGKIGDCKKFNIIDWLSEAWLCGLLESPGLDVIEDDDFMNLLNYVQKTFSENHLYQNSNELGINLSYGEDYNKLVIESLDKLMYIISMYSKDTNDYMNIDDDDDDNDFISNKRSSKYRRLNYTSNSMNTKSVKITTKKYEYSLNPCWVLLANCLLEHGCINILKDLDKLTPPGQESPVNLNFKYSWIWLRFCRLKSRFDKLTSLLFTPSGIDHHSNIPDLLELGCTVNQIQLLTTIAKHWFSSKSSSSPHLSMKSSTSENPVQLSMETYLSYAKLVIFLFRLGLLPQSNEKLCDSKYYRDKSSRVNSTVLQSYNSSMLSGSIDELRNTRLMSNQPDDFTMNNENITNQLTTIGEHLLYTALQSPLKKNSDEDNCFTGNEVHDVWREQEQVLGSNQSSACRNDESLPLFHTDVPDWLSYPPRHIQSLCALWQLPCNAQIKRSRLAVLGFLLCDAAAETFLIHCNYQTCHRDIVDNDCGIDGGVNGLNKSNSVQMDDNVDCKTSRGLKALKMESISPNIISFIINSCESQTIPSSSWQVYSHLFPNQTNIIINLFKHYGKNDLIGNLLKYLNTSSHSPNLYNHINDCKAQLSFQGLFKVTSNTTTTTTTNNSSNYTRQLLNMKPVGAPYLALSRLRNLIQKMNQLHNHKPLPVDMLNSVDKLARDSLIQLAEICRQDGRLGDLIGLGLSIWEAKVLFEYYRKIGQHNLLFHCFIARSQYQTAMAIFQEYRRVVPCNNNYRRSEVLHNPTSFTDDEQRVQLQLMTQLLYSCLPLMNNTHNNIDDPERLTLLGSHNTDYFKALANKYVSMDDFQTHSESSSSVNNDVQDANGDVFQHSLDNDESFIAYKHTKAVPCSLINMKNIVKQKSSIECPLTSVNGSIPSDDDNDEAAADDTRCIINKSNSWLLATNKKHRQEFWNTFKELKSLHQSCGLNSDIWLNENRRHTTNSTTTPTPSANLSESRLKFSRKRESPSKEDDVTQQLLKCIYTPPSCGRKPVHLNSASYRISPSALLSNSKFTLTNQKPVSILKTRTGLLDKVKSTSTTTAVTTTTTVSSSPTLQSSSSVLSSFIKPVTSSSSSLSKPSTESIVKRSEENYLPNYDNNVSNVNEDDMDVINEVEDCDVTLNLSTVRPSVVNVDKPESASSNNVNELIDFTFSAPRRISLTSSTLISGNVSTEKKEFSFSAPLLNKTFTYIRSVENFPDSFPAISQSDVSSKGDDDVLKSDQVTPSDDYLMEIINTPSLNKTPILTPSKLHSIKEYQKETLLLMDDYVTPKVTRSHRTRDNKTLKLPVESTSEAIFDQLDYLHQERNRCDIDDFDDTSSVTSSVTDLSDTVRRSTRRVKPPKRYDPSEV
ncbi:unnamed protein product [Heterobilharzia americana]|nr:unnamed protein product [Heterobilharzia americana]